MFRLTFVNIILIILLGTLNFLPLAFGQRPMISSSPASRTQEQYFRITEVNKHINFDNVGAIKFESTRYDTYENFYTHTVFFRTHDQEFLECGDECVRFIANVEIKDNGCDVIENDAYSAVGKSYRCQVYVKSNDKSSLPLPVITLEVRSPNNKEEKFTYSIN